MGWRLVLAAGVLGVAGCTAIDGISAPPAAATEPAETAPAVEASELESITPEAEAVRVGYAGEDPADIARYLLASGAQTTAFSPDGETIAFRYDITGARQVWTVPATGGQPTQLTFGNGITFFRWSPDGTEILYGADNDGNEQEAYFAIAADGSSERKVLDTVEGGFRSFGAFTADGSQFAYASTERNGLDFDIYIADATTGESRRLFEGQYGNFVVAVSPSGDRMVLSETVGEDSDNLYLLDVESGVRTVLSKPEVRANHTDAGLVWSADGASLYMASNEGREFAALTRYDLETESFETLVEDDFDISEVELCGPSDKYIVWTTNEDGFERLHAMQRESRAMLTPPALPEGTHQLSCRAGGPELAIRTNGWATPGDVNVWNMETGEVTRSFASNMAGLDATRLIRPESIRMTARDGVELQGLLYVPDETSMAGDSPPPVVFDVHGGPTAQSMANFESRAQYLVDRGIAVFQPNVRGSTGFGRTYVTLDDREKRLDSVRDLIDMLAALEEDGRVDTSRAAVMGGSYGGYMVNAVLAEYPDAFKAGVSLFGVADWVTALEIASPALKASDLIEYGDINDPEWRAFYEVNSPIRQADRIRVPVLFSHGEMDPRIDIAETEVMVRALRANGIEAPFIRIPDEGHGWRKLSNRLFYFRREAEFLEAQLAE